MELNPREQIERDYDVVDGRITSPGKFEGEQAYVSFYWESYMNGVADRDNGKVLGFDIRKGEGCLFVPLLFMVFASSDPICLGSFITHRNDEMNF